MRGGLSRLVSLFALGALGLAGCASSPIQASQGGAATAVSASAGLDVSRQVALDDGAFTFTPDSSQPAMVGPAVVRADLARAWDQTVQQLGPLALGTIRWGSGLSSKVVGQGSVVWVQLYRDDRDLSDGTSYCSGHFAPATPTPTPLANPSRQHVLVVNAQTGAAVIYAGAGPASCTPYAPPRILTTEGQDSVPWTALGRHLIRVTLPPCSLLSSYGPRAQGWMVTAARPIGPCHKPSKIITLTNPARLPHQHGAIGSFCARVAEGVTLPRPSACLTW